MKKIKNFLNSHLLQVGFTVTILVTMAILYGMYSLIKSMLTVEQSMNVLTILIGVSVVMKVIERIYDNRRFHR